MISRPAAPETVLVVDDTAENLRLLTQILSEGGYNVRAVTSGSRALESARATPPNLILLDIRMPEMDGFEVCARLKSEPLCRETPILFISALNDTQDKVRGFAAGGIDYITKPFQVEEVLARVEAQLAVRRLQRQVQEANRRYQDELALAGSLQASFFPSEAPAVPGWQFAMKLMPAREMSGDFYDVFLLPDGNLGLLVADVVDKGAAAGLFMALSWTLLRTFTDEFPSSPARVLSEVNRRIVADTDGSRFVTVLYGTLDPAQARFTYGNAGHNPALLLRKGANQPELLHRTGRLLGMFTDNSWDESSVEIGQEDGLVLYTDGVTEACNANGDLFGFEALVQAAQSLAGRTADEILNGIVRQVERHLGGEHQTDDIAMVVGKHTGDGSSSD